MNTFAFLSVIALIFIGSGCLSPDTTGSASTDLDRDSILVEARENGLIMNEDEVVAMAQTTPVEDPAVRAAQDIEAYLDTNVRDWFSAALADVTGGTSFGLAHSQFASGTFTLVVEMGNLPEPASGYFYEGWLVRRTENFSLMSTGRAVKTQDGFTNVYLSGSELQTTTSTC